MRLRQRNGAAMVMVLWVMILVMMLAMNLTGRSHLELEMIEAEQYASQSRMLAEAGMEGALFYLVGEGKLPAIPGQLGLSFDGPGDRITFPFRGGLARVRIRDEGRKANVLKMGQPELQRFFVEFGFENQRAAELAAAVVDWLDADDLLQPGGAERSDYLAVGAQRLPPNGPIEDISGLAGVRGLPLDILWSDDPYANKTMSAGLEEFLTFYGDNRAPSFSLDDASVGVLVRWGGLSPEEAVGLVAFRENHLREFPGLAIPMTKWINENVDPERQKTLFYRHSAEESDLWAVECEGFPAMDRSNVVPVKLKTLLLREKDPETEEISFRTLRKDYL